MMTTPSDPSPAANHPSGRPGFLADVAGDEAVGRLHPASVIFRAGGTLRNVFLAVVAGTFTGTLGWLWGLLPFLLVSLAAELIGYARYRYRLAPDELIIEEGLFSRRVRTIPYARVQNVDTVQNVLHRLLGVAEVRIETASGQGAEATMRVLGLADVEALRRFVLDRRADESAAPVAPPSDDRPIVQLGLAEIIAHGLTRNQRATLFFAALGIGWNVLEWTGAGGAWWDRLSLPNVVGWYGQLFRLDELWLLGRAVAIGVGVLAALVAVLTLLGALWSVTQLWRFTLTRSGEDLRARYGLFTRHVATIPRFRVQSLAIWDSPFYRWLDRVAISVETAGGGKPGEGESAGKRTWLAPIWPRERLGELLAEVQPGLDVAALDWQPVHPDAARRMRRRGLRVAIIIAIGLALVPYVRWLGLVVLVMLAGWTLLDAPRTAAGLGWALTDEVFAVRNGWIRRTVAIARLGKIQSVSLTASPFDRRAGMAAVQIDTAGRSDGEHAMAVPFLALAEAEALRDALSAAAALPAARSGLA